MRCSWVCQLLDRVYNVRALYHKQRRRNRKMHAK
jgi:hypothetical protein